MPCAWRRDRRPALDAAPTAQRPTPSPADDSDEDLRAHIARTTFAIYHPVGTCAIGSVVDPELRVHGVEALRVVDASVMPTVPAATPTRRRSPSPSAPPT